MLQNSLRKPRSASGTCTMVALAYKQMHVCYEKVGTFRWHATVCRTEIMI
jgi:hypothetical protein